MIDTQAIRSKILDLAMRGKLAEQRADEKLVFAKGGRLSLAATARGDAPLPIPYSIPGNWKWVRIADVITKDVGGGTPSKSVDEYWKNGTIPWMSVKDFSSAKNGVLEDTIDHITPAGLANSTSNLVDVDAIIVCMRMALGKIVKLRRPMAINQDLRAIWLDPCVDRHFFVYYYSTLRVEGHGMTVAGISKKQLMEFVFPLPPLAEQQRIVARIEQAFSALDTIDALQAKYADNLAVLKSKLIDAAIQGKLTEQLPEDGTAEELYRQIQSEKQALIKSGKIKKEKPLPEISADEIPFEIPANWYWCRLQSVYNFIDYRGATPNKISNGVPFVTAKNVRQGHIDYSVSEFISEEDYQKRQSRGVSRRGDILFTTEAPMGYAAIADLDRFSAGQRLITLQQYTDNPLLENKYYMFAISAPFFQKQLDEKCSGTTVKGIKADRLKRFLIPIPPLAEQKRIVAKLEELLPLCERLK